MDNFDARVIFVLAPILVAAGWAAFNIGAAALRQIQGFINRKA